MSRTAYRDRATSSRRSGAKLVQRGSEVKDKQVGEHRGRVYAGSKTGGAHDTETGPAIENLQTEEPEDPQLHPEQALAGEQQRRQWVGLDAPMCPGACGLSQRRPRSGERVRRQAARVTARTRAAISPGELGAPVGDAVTSRFYNAPVEYLGSRNDSRDSRLLGRTVAFWMPRPFQYPSAYTHCD